jgi:hypothetical protein
MKPRAWLTVLVSTASAGSVWALSPLLTGHREPWDTDGINYVVALAVAGFVAASIVPRPLWAHYLGALVGQLGYALLFLPAGPFTVLGAAFLLGYSLIFLAAAALAAFARTRLSSRSQGKG